MVQGKERRQHPRFSANLDASITAPDGCRVYAYGKVRNISRGGVLVEATSDGPEPMDLLYMHVALTMAIPKEPFEVTYLGVVVWSSQNPEIHAGGSAPVTNNPNIRGYGIQLLDLNPTQEHELVELLGTLKPEPI